MALQGEQTAHDSRSRIGCGWYQGDLVYNRDVVGINPHTALIHEQRLLSHERHANCEEGQSLVLFNILRGWEKSRREVAEWWLNNSTFICDQSVTFCAAASRREALS